MKINFDWILVTNGAKAFHTFLHCYKSKPTTNQTKEKQKNRRTLYLSVQKYDVYLPSNMLENVSRVKCTLSMRVLANLHRFSNVCCLVFMSKLSFRKLCANRWMSVACVYMNSIETIAEIVWLILSLMNRRILTPTNIIMDVHESRLGSTTTSCGYAFISHSQMLT